MTVAYCFGENAAQDECGECYGTNACLDAIQIVSINGGLNEVLLMWTPNPLAAAYNVYRDGELACTIPAGDAYLHPVTGLPFYLDDGTCGDDTGWGLGYDTEYCYSVSVVSGLWY